MGLDLSGLGTLLRRGIDDVGSAFTGQPAQSNPTSVGNAPNPVNRIQQQPVQPPQYQQQPAQLPAMFKPQSPGPQSPFQLPGQNQPPTQNNIPGQRNLFQKSFDQINPFDNGRTFQNGTPVAAHQGSVFQQATQPAVEGAKGFAQGLSNSAVGGVVRAAANIVPEAAAAFSNNPQALQNARNAAANDIHSIPSTLSTDLAPLSMDHNDPRFKQFIQNEAMGAEGAPEAAAKAFKYTGNAVNDVAANYKPLNEVGSVGKDVANTDAGALGKAITPAVDKEVVSPSQPLVDHLQGIIDGKVDPNAALPKTVSNGKDLAERNPQTSQSAIERQPPDFLQPDKQGTEIGSEINSSTKAIPQSPNKVNLDRELSPYESMVAAQNGMSDREYLATQNTNGHELEPTNDAAYDQFHKNNAPVDGSKDLQAAFPRGVPDITPFESEVPKTAAQAAIEVASKRKPGTYDEAVKAYMEHSPGIDLATAKAETTAALEAANKTPLGGTKGEYAKNEAPYGMKSLEVNPGVPYDGKLKIERSTSKIMSLEARANKTGEAGQEFTQRANNVHAEQSVIRQKMDDASLPAVEKLSKADQATVSRVLEGKEKTTDPTIQKAVDDLRNHFKDTLQTSRVYGVAGGDQGANYFPHMFEKGHFDSEKTFNGAVKHLVDTNQAPNRVAAVKLMNEYKQGDYMGGNKFSNLEQHREVDLPGYRTDTANVVREYNAGVSKRMAETSQFGPNNEKINELISRAAGNNQDAKTLQEVINSYLNPKRPADNVLSKTLGGYQKALNTIQLTKAAVSHIPQGFANVGTHTGFGNYFNDVRKQLFDPESRQFLHDAGLDVEKHDHKTSGANVVTAPGLRQIREFHRDTAALGGRDIALGMAERGDEAGLRRFGVAGNLARDDTGKITLTKDQQVQAAHRLTDKTIFSDSPLQSPAWTQGTLGKFTSQYKKAYVFKQSEFIGNLFSEAKAGRVAPLLRYLGVALPVSGIVVTAGKNLIKNPTQNPLPTNEKDAKKFALDSLKNSGGLSFAYGAGDTALNLARYHRNGDQVWQGIAGAVAPGAGTAVQTGQNISQAKNGNAKPLEKQGLTSIPLVGNHIADAMFPKKTVTPDQQAYYDAKNQGTNNLSGPANKRDLDVYNAYFDRNKTPDGKSIQLSASDKLAQNRELANNPNALGNIQKVETASSNHDPIWDLKGVGTINGENVPQLALLEAYKSLAPGDLQKTAILQQNPWINQAENDQAAWMQKQNFTGNSAANPDDVARPVQDPAVVDKQSQLYSLEAINSADRTPEQTQQLKALFNDPDIATAEHDKQVYTNAVRDKLHLPEIQYPGATDPDVKAGWNSYNGLASGKGIHDRSDFIKANPDLWAKMQQSSLDENMFKIDKYGGQAYYGAKVPDSFLGSIYGVGNYDISKLKNADGSSSYSLLNFLNTNSGAGGTGVGKNGLPTVNANSPNGSAKTSKGESFAFNNSYQKRTKRLKVQKGRGVRAYRPGSMKRPHQLKSRTPQSHLHFANQSKFTLKDATPNKRIKIG